ncbi:MAG: hypothetical protein EAZ81_04665 [Verrucomicrobia bacterium]|nr:MAG: hypothetical protein EAZ81_04665 [Verrucomicrobiota bacterium]
MKSPLVRDEDPAEYRIKPRAPKSNPRVPWVWITVLVGMVLGTAILFSPVAVKIKRALLSLRAPQRATVREEKDLIRQIENRLRAEWEVELAEKIAAMKKQMEQAEVAPLEDPPVPPAPPQGLAGVDVTTLRNGIPFYSEVLAVPGGVASRERLDQQSYKAEYKLTFKMPTAAKSIDELKVGNPEIDRMLPKLPELLEKAIVSPQFHTLYQNKFLRIKQDANKLNQVLSKHNLYDLETILLLRDTTTKRRVFLMQSEMDVVSDGSDGDRMPVMPPEIVDSTNYQPFTSYGWKKTTNVPNPMIAGWEKRIKLAEEELANPATPPARQAWLRERMSYLRRGIDDMKSRSFLIAEVDPFIVIPIHILTAKNDPYAPRVGDYAVVIHEGKIYPAIVGDGGPSFKAGEASLRLARAINPSANPYRRPVSDLKVTYLVFPNSRDAQRSAPNYPQWKQRCEQLLSEIGGVGPGFTLHDW